MRIDTNFQTINYVYFIDIFLWEPCLKTGMKDTDSDVVTALRTTVILYFSWISVFIMRIEDQLLMISYRSLVFLILSGLSTGASWICYFRALQLGNINKIVPIDKSSVILTMLLAFIFLQEPISVFSIIAMFAIGVGTYLMLQRKKQKYKQQIIIG